MGPLRNDADPAVRAAGPRGLPCISTESMQNETSRGLETPARQAESSGSTTLAHTGFVCRGCGFEAATREEFDADGLAMACPECSSTCVEQDFSEMGA